MRNRLHGFCAACKKDLYTDPVRHYQSDAHWKNVRRANERESVDIVVVKRQQEIWER